MSVLKTDPRVLAKNARSRARHKDKWNATSRRKRAEDPVEHTKTAFRAMWQRCTNPAKSNYKYYGGRGITVCERWRVFENFVADVGLRPHGLTIDRFPNKNGNYEPGNVRWATHSEQMRNRGPMPVKCTCGVCQTCKNREYYRKHRAKGRAA
jgi:hypothetical protein